MRKPHFDHLQAYQRECLEVIDCYRKNRAYKLLRSLRLLLPQANSPLLLRRSGDNEPGAKEWVNTHEKLSGNREAL